MKNLIACLPVALLSTSAFAAAPSSIEIGKFACYSSELNETVYFDSQASNDTVKVVLGRFAGTFKVANNKASTSLISAQGERVYATLTLTDDGTFRQPQLTLSTQFQRKNVSLECDVQD